jgi:hypothetical protein
LLVHLFLRHRFASMALLPLEITDRIIDFLHDDRKALYTCRLVCREWIHSSRTHLFWAINLSTNRKPGILQSLGVYNPAQVGIYVRDLLVDTNCPLVDHERLVDLCLLFKNVSKLHITAYRMCSGVLLRFCHHYHP